MTTRSILSKMLLLVALFLAATGCESTGLGKNEEVTTKVKLEKSAYPKTIGEDARAYDVAVFVKNRTDFARQLYSDGRLNDCITVLRDLVKYIPDSIKNRYDLGLMLFQRASPHIKEYREASKVVDTLAGAGKTKEADEQTAKLQRIFDKMKGDLEECLNQLTIYASARADDPRPIDLMWRVQMALGDYVGAYSNLERIVKWPSALRPETRTGYEEIMRYINDVLESTANDSNLRGRGFGQGDYDLVGEPR